MSLLSDLSELIEAKVISEETALKIKQHFDQKNTTSYNKLYVIFGILGSLLVGLGIILIIAHNWDSLERNVKLVFAMLPLVVAQFLCGYTLFRKRENIVWAESTSTFLTLSVAASIALISQIYNMPEDLPAFLLIWTTISLPIIYIMRSSMVSLIFIAGITWYAGYMSYFNYPNEVAWRYWILLAAAIPHYIILYRTKRKSNFFHFHTWFIVISLTITTGMFREKIDDLNALMYLNLFSIFILIDELGTFDQNRLSISAFRVASNFGTLLLFIFLSFNSFWNEVVKKQTVNLLYSVDSYPFWILLIIAIILMVPLIRRQSISKAEPLSYAFVPGFLLFLLCYVSANASWLLANLVVLIFGIYTIRRGARYNMLGIMNYGLLIIATLIVCRFFDLDLSFVTRGVLFIAVGLSFFFANLYLIRKRNLQNNENKPGV